MPETTPIPVLRWRCDIARPAPRALQIYRGETARLECLLTLQGDPATIPADATALIAWQSRDMGASWYTAPATVDVPRGAVLADFTPAMDSGAAEYSLFLRVDGGEGSGICYRAQAFVQMLASPGATINEIPIPPRVLDFATIEVLNAPYWTKAEADARFVPTSRTVNGKDLSANIALDSGDISAQVASPASGSVGAVLALLDSATTALGTVVDGIAAKIPSGASALNKCATASDLPLVVTGDLDLSTMAVSNLSHTYAVAAAAVAAGRDAFLDVSASGVHVFGRLAMSAPGTLNMAAILFGDSMGIGISLPTLVWVDWDSSMFDVYVRPMLDYQLFVQQFTAESWTFSLSGGGTVTKTIWTMP